MEITPIILFLLCSIACVSLFYLFKALKQFNEKNGKVQSSKVSIAYILLNICTFAMSFYVIHLELCYLGELESDTIFWSYIVKPLARSSFYPGVLSVFSVLLIPIGTIQLLLWDKLGLISLFLGSCSYCYFLVNTGVLIYPPGTGLMEIFITAMSLPIVIQFALLFVKKDGINSWSQLEFGFSFRKLKLLYLLFAAIILLV